MYTNMKTLLDAKFYNTKKEATDKLDVFFAMDKLNKDQFVELTLLADTQYPESDIVQ